MFLFIASTAVCRAVIIKIAAFFEPKDKRGRQRKKAKGGHKEKTRSVRIVSGQQSREKYSLSFGLRWFPVPSPPLTSLFYRTGVVPLQIRRGTGRNNPLAVVRNAGRGRKDSR